MVEKWYEETAEAGSIAERRLSFELLVGWYGWCSFKLWDGVLPVILQE